MAKYDHIGKNYNSTRKADPYLVSRLTHHVSPSPNGRYLDVGCGTGNYTCALASTAGLWTGIDPSQEMLNKAFAKCEEVDWIQGTAEDFELEHKSFDKCLCTLTLHHWSNLEAGFSNIRQHLKSEGMLIIFTATPKQMANYWLNHYFPKMMEDSIAQMPSFDLVSSSLDAAGFSMELCEDYEIRADLQDLFLYSGKQDPEKYFNEHIRRGISSFSSLANKDEVEAGLEKLRSDLDTGRFEDVKQRFRLNTGDYMYIVCSRS